MKPGLLLFFSLLFLVPARAQKVSPPFKVVGYYSLRAATGGRVGRVPFKLLTHVNLAFLNPDSTGSFSQDLSRLSRFVKAAHKKQVKVLFSIAGGGRHPQYHELLKDSCRAALVDSLLAKVLKYDLDGLDVDLEGRDIDENYESFVIDLAQALKAHDKLLTAAIAVYYKDQLTDSALSQYDFVNVMSYDRTGPWRPQNPGQHSAYQHAVDDLSYFATERAIPRDKITLGVPFYGYGFGPDSTFQTISMNFREIVSQFHGAEQADQWNMPDGRIIYYNGIPTIQRKAELAKTEAAGIMIWQIRGDAKGRKSLLRAINEVGR